MLQLLHNSDVDKMPIVTQNNVATEWEQRYLREQRKLASARRNVAFTAKINYS